MSGWAVAAAAAALGLTALVAIGYGIFGSVLNVRINDARALTPRYAPADTLVDVYGALMMFDPYGKLRAFVPTTPAVMRWDAADNDARVFAPDPADFASTVGANTYAFALVPGALAGQTCPFWYNTAYDARGRPLACTGGAAPGQPFGLLPLDFQGLVDFAYLPPILYEGPAFRGYWNAANNTPSLTNATCGAGGKFYYVVSDAGNTPLGPHTDWHPLDQAVCFNGTWDHVASAGVDSVFGRVGVVAAAYADYSSALVEHAGAPLSDTLGAQYVLLAPSAGLPNAAQLAAVPGDLTLVGATFGLPAAPAFPLANNTVAGYAKNPVVDRQGRWVYTDVGQPVETITGTPNQITPTCAGYTCVLALSQDIATNSTPTFAAVFYDTDRVVPASPSGGNAFQLPSNAGTAGQVLRRTGTGTQWEDPRLEAVVGANGVQIQQLSGTNASIGIDPVGNFTAHSATLQMLVLNGAPYSSAIVSITAVPPLVATANTSSSATVSISPNPAFATVTVGGAVFSGSGAADIRAPVINGTMVLDAGAQTIGGAKTFTSAIVAAGDVGVQCNNAANTFSASLRAGAGLAQNLTFRAPINYGTAGDVLATDGAGNHAYVANGASIVRFVSSAVVTRTGAAFVSLYGTGAGTLTIPANTLGVGTSIYVKFACSFISGAGTSTYRVVLGGTTLVTSAALANVVSTPMNIELTIWSVTATTAVVEGSILRGSTVSVFTQPSPVTINPAVPNVFDVQVQFSSAASVSSLGTVRVVRDLT